MKLDVDLAKFTYRGAGAFALADYPQKLREKLYASKTDYHERLDEFVGEIDELQTKMYAHNRYAMVIIFQAMDAAGKDGTIAHVMRGINPHGFEVHAFKQPSNEELEHDFLWRTTQAMPQRGRIAIFNRSYYEEVLVAKVHPEIVSEHQRLPRERTADFEALWASRYKAIRDHEAHMHASGTRVVKFFLNVSKAEQRTRLLARIDEPAKNWKFSEADVAERQFWGEYMAAYGECIAATSTRDCPWYIVPADNKKSMRLIVSKIVLDRLAELDLHYPEVSDQRRKELAKVRTLLENE